MPAPDEAAAIVRDWLGGSEAATSVADIESAPAKPAADPSAARRAA
jgi:hypothetical protein